VTAGRRPSRYGRLDSAEAGEGAGPHRRRAEHYDGELGHDGLGLAAECALDPQTITMAMILPSAETSSAGGRTPPTVMTRVRAQPA
jgi:hypothetical protein